MKKVLFVVMAVMAIGFTSCGNKTQATAETTDSVAVMNVEDEIAGTISALTEQINAQDANKFQEALAAVQAKLRSRSWLLPTPRLPRTSWLRYRLS